MQRSGCFRRDGRPAAAALPARELIAVGTVIADRPPHRSVRAELPHTVLTVDVDMQTSRGDRGGGSSVSVASVWRAWRTFPKSAAVRVGCVVAGCGAT